LNWLQKLEKYILQRSIEKLGLWKEDFENTKKEIIEEMEMEETNNNDKIDKKVIQAMCRKALGNNNGHIKYYIDSNGRPMLEKSKYLVINQPVYVKYRPENYTELIKQNIIQFTEIEKKILQLHKTLELKKYNHNSEKLIGTNNQNNINYFKNIIPLYNFNGQVIRQETEKTLIHHGDVVCLCLSFKKRNYPTFGIKYKLNWIQMFRKRKRLKK